MAQKNRIKNVAIVGVSTVLEATRSYSSRLIKEHRLEATVANS